MSIEERLLRLERENRRLKVAGLLVLLITASALLMGQTRIPQRIESEKFVLKDRRGVDIAFFGTAYSEGSDVGMPWLGFYEADGTIKTYLQVIDGIASLRVGAPGGGAVTITARPDGDTRVSVSASPGSSSPEVNLRALPGGNTASVFTASGGSVTSMMQYTRGDTSGILWLLNSSQQPVWTAP